MIRLARRCLLAALALAAATQASAGPNDQYYNGVKAPGGDFYSQWGLKRIGFEKDDALWGRGLYAKAPPVIAIVDTGLDWNHLDFDYKSLWRNPREIPNNGKDDDGNGYVDDIIGWDFFANSNRPWDHDGHGTFVTGIIAARTNNLNGVAGVDPNVRIMVVKAVNNFGHTRASFLADGIKYAADNGARVINLSVGGPDLADIEKDAIDYAVSKGALVVVAAGNQGVKIEGRGPAAHPAVLTVAATGPDDKRTAFSNWGAEIDIAAPGVDILSLRARRTDTMLGLPGLAYKPGDAIVGDDRRYYRTSGTSFAAPFVSGVAAILLAQDPTLKGADLARILKQSARDIDTPGVDQYSGYGLLDARAAVAIDRNFYVEAAISGLAAGQGASGPVVIVSGTAAADQFAGAHIEIGAGENPASWTRLPAAINAPVRDGLLGEIEASRLQGSKVWIVRVVTAHRNGKTREARFRLALN